MIYLLLLVQIGGVPAVPAGTACDTIAVATRIDITVAGRCRLEGGIDDVRILGVGNGEAAAAFADGFARVLRLFEPHPDLSSGSVARAALNDFAAAVSLDSTLVEAGLLSGQLALLTRLPDHACLAYEILEGLPQALPSVRALLAETALECGLPPPRVPANRLTPAEVRVDAIRSFRSSNPADWIRADSLYFAALRMAPPAARQAEADLGPLLRDLGDRSIEHFWTVAAAEAGTTRPERLHVHFVRLRYAYDAYYDWPRMERRDTLAHPIGRFDARGDAFIRHGAPARTIRTSVPGRDFVTQYESWVYAGRWAEPFVIHFRVANRDARLTTIANCRAEWLMPLAGIDPNITRVVTACMEPDRRTGARLAAANRAIAADHARVLATQSLDLQISDPITLRTATAWMRERDGGLSLIVVAGIPLVELRSSAETGSVGIAGTVFAVTPGAVLQADEDLHRDPALAPSAQLALAFVLPTSEPPEVLRAVIRDANRPTAGIGVSLSAREPGTVGHMSDILILESSGDSNLNRFGVPLSVSPDIVFGRRFAIYYELYGLEEERYAVTIRLRRENASFFSRLLGRDEALSVDFTRPRLETVANVSAYSLEIDAGSLDDGTYEMEVDVRTHDFREVRRRTLRFESSVH